MADDGESAAAGVRAIRASHVLTFLPSPCSSPVARARRTTATSRSPPRPRPPGVAGVVGLTWLAVVGWLSAVLGIVVPWWFERRHGGLDADAQRQWIVGLIGVQVVALVALALTGSFLVAAAVSLVIGRVRSLRQSLLGGWIVPLTPRDRRATVLSTLEQADSISQVTIGPGMGVIGQVAGIPAAFVASAVLLAPSALAVRVAGDDVKRDVPPAKIGG